MYKLCNQMKRVSMVTEVNNQAQFQTFGKLCAFVIMHTHPLSHTILYGGKQVQDKERT